MMHNALYRRWLLRLYQYVAAHVRGPKGTKARRWICRRLFLECGENVNVELGAEFGDGSQVRIGDHSGLGVACRVYGPVSIGRNVMMGPEVIIFHRSHNATSTDVPMSHQGYGPERTLYICDDVWIGARAVILPQCGRIGRGAILGAGSVVTHDVPDYAVVVGNPARLLRQRQLTHEPRGEAKLTLPSGILPQDRT